jgi:hypothetical protein
MFTKTVHPLDLLLAVLAASMPGAAIWYWMAVTRKWEPADFLMGLAALLVAAYTILVVVSGMIAFAIWFFRPHR